MAQREYAKAISEFKKLGNYKDAKEQINNAYYYIAESLLLQLNYADTDATIQKAKTNGPVRFSTIIEMYQSIAHCASAIAVGQHHAIGLKADGTVVATGKNDEGQLNVRSWRDIVAVSAAGNHTVGLKADGTVVATGDNSLGQINVGGWREIIAISNERFNCLGLKADGTVVSTRSLGTEAWHDIVAISRTAGLKNDGTVVSIKGTYFEVDAWRDVVAIAENSFHLVGLRADGTVVATGRNDEGQLNVESWRDIVAISAGTYDTFGIKADGTVMAARKHDSSSAIIWNDIAKKWSDIVAISAGLLHAVGLKADGTVVGVGFWLEDRLEINDWRNIKAGTPFSYNREN